MTNPTGGPVVWESAELVPDICHLLTCTSPGSLHHGIHTDRQMNMNSGFWRRCLADCRNKQHQKSGICDNSDGIAVSSLLRERLVRIGCGRAPGSSKHEEYQRTVAANLLSPLTYV